jgi:2-oxoisovalerate dehydrogenase E1 component
VYPVAEDASGSADGAEAGAGGGAGGAGGGAGGAGGGAGGAGGGAGGAGGAGGGAGGAGGGAGGADLSIVTFGNGLRLSLRAAARLRESGIGCRVMDLRWLAPLPAAEILREAEQTGRVLIADETRRTGGVSEAVVTALTDGGFTGRIARVTSEDSFIPLGDAAAAVLLSEQMIEAAARDLARGG